MKVMLNCATLVMGGSLQAAVSFILEVTRANESDGIDWCFALSKQIKAEVSNAAVEPVGPVRVLEVSPAHSAESRRVLLDCERDWSPDVVFTFFGPAYVDFHAPHLCGVANGWVTHSSLLAFQRLGWGAKCLRTMMRIIYRGWWYRKADAWVVEAENAKRGLIRRFWIKPEAISVVPNTCGDIYREQRVQSRFPRKGEKIRILCLSAYYRHKNLEIIPDVARHMRRMANRLDFEFVVTLPSDDAGLRTILEKAKLFGVESCINNIGPVPLNEGPEIYESCHIAFLPSLLETFSANYPEAMAMQRPIVTTDLDFARDVCKDAALYYEATNAEAAAEQIVSLINDPKLLGQQVSKGEAVLQGLPTPKDKCRQYIDILKTLCVR